MNSGDLLTITAAASLLGWKKQHVESYRQRGVFPEPDQYIVVGEGKQQPVWLRSTIEKYKAEKFPG